MLVNWHNIELFSVPPARDGLVYAATPVFWHDLESLNLLVLATLLCYSVFLGVIRLK